MWQRQNEYCCKRWINIWVWDLSNMVTIHAPSSKKRSNGESSYLGLPVQQRLAGQAYIFCCCTFLCIYFFWRGTYRWELAQQASRYYTNSGAPGWTHKISTRSTHVAPFYRVKCPKFRPQSSLDRRIFEVRHFIGNPKQIYQGSMIGLSPHQTWGSSVPPTLRTVGAMGTQKGKSG